MYVKHFFLPKPEQFTDFPFFSFPVPPSPGQKETFVKSELLVNKELKRRQAHWFVEICQSLSGWLHICLRNNSYLYSARAAGQAPAVWRRSASLRGFAVGIPNDSPTSLWEGGEKSCLPLMRDRALMIFIQPWLGLRFRLPVLKSGGSFFSHTLTASPRLLCAGRWVSRLELRHTAINIAQPISMVARGGTGGDNNGEGSFFWQLLGKRHYLYPLPSIL